MVSASLVPRTHEFFVYVSLSGLFSILEGGFRFSGPVFPLGGRAQSYHELLCLLPMSRSATMCYILIIQASIMILGHLTERITCTVIKHKRKETQRIFLGETIKEKTHNFLRDRINTKSKTQKHKDDLSTAVSLLSQQLLLSLMCPSEWVCVW